MNLPLLPASEKHTVFADSCPKPSLHPQLFETGLTSFSFETPMAYLLIEDVAQERVQRPHCALLSDVQVSIGTQGVKYAGQLHSNVAGPDYGYAFGLLLQREKPVTATIQHTNENRHGMASKYCDGNRALSAPGG